jgi:hypothetical protein
MSVSTTEILSEYLIPQYQVPPVSESQKERRFPVASTRGRPGWRGDGMMHKGMITESYELR